MPDAVTHPTSQELIAFGLGKLAKRAAAAVAAHLESCSDCRKAVANVPPDSFLGKVRAAAPVGSSFPPGLAMPSSVGQPALPNAPGSDIPPELARHPKYQILRELGRGGMGVVYQARQTGMMIRQVVIKVVNRSLIDQPAALERFLREVQAAAQLSHPNIVTAYDAEKAGDLHMLVMEFVPGQSLAEVLAKKGPLPVANACQYVRQVALGLQHACDRGMVHRDIKPQNLMLMPKGQVKILDFGLAKAVSERGANKGLTGSDAYMGTPDYCAPEQATDARAADIRADLYSLGCTLYCLLAGHPPFQEDTAMKTILAHLQQTPRPLPELRPDVPEKLWRVVARLLAKNPGQRYQKPIEVAQALTPFVKPGSGSPEKGTKIAADTSQIKEVLREVPGKTPPKKETVKTAAASPFENLKDTSGAGDSRKRRPTKRKGRWVFLAGVGILMLAFVGMWASGVFKVKTKEGTIVLENLPADAEVLVDGETITLKAGDGKTITITTGKKHRVQVKKEGFKVFGKEVEIDAGERRPIRVSLLPEPPAIKPPPPGPKRGAEDKGFVPLFNGKDLTGWKSPPEWEGIWQVEDGALILNSPNRTELRTDRDDYGDFHLRAEIRIGHIQYAQLYFRGGYVIALNCINGNPRKTGSLCVPSRGWMTVSKSPVPPNQWFTLEVIAEGNHVAVKVDGQTTADYEDAAGRFTHGPITLAGARHEDSSLEYRKIEIKELRE